MTKQAKTSLLIAEERPSPPSDILQPAPDFFLPPHARQLRHALTLNPAVYGEVWIMVTTIRRRQSADPEHFGLASFCLN